MIGLEATPQKRGEASLMNSDKLADSDFSAKVFLHKYLYDQHV